MSLTWLKAESASGIGNNSYVVKNPIKKTVRSFSVMNNFSRRDFLRHSSLATIGLMLSKHSFANMSTDYTYFSIAEVSELIRQKKVSPVDLVNACLKRIELLNPKLNAFITVTGEV